MNQPTTITVSITRTVKPGCEADSGHLVHGGSAVNDAPGVHGYPQLHLMRWFQRKRSHFALSAAIVLTVSCTLSQAAEPPAYQTLRYNEDWSVLRNSTNRTDFFDPVKYIPLNTNGDWYLSFGGEARLEYVRYSD
ncbi:MAG: hypothetical protein ABI651_18195, partial [Verrucomicrobiota bacterium]